MLGSWWTAVCCWGVCFLAVCILPVEAECTWEAFPNRDAVGGTAKSGIMNADDCKAQCNEGCVAVKFKGDEPAPCFLFSQHPVLEDEDPLLTVTFYNKTCATATTTATPTTAPSDQCSMVEIANMDVTSQPTLEISGLSAEACQTGCQLVEQCLAFSYGGDTCTLHTSQVTTSQTPGYTFSSKTSCSDGTQCCFPTEADTAATSTSFYSFSAQSVADSCKQMCAILTACRAVDVSEGTCKVYTSEPDTESHASLSYFARTSCSEPDTLTINDACDSSAAIQVSKLLVFMPLVIIICTTWF